MTEPATMTLHEASSCRDCIRRHIGEALFSMAKAGSPATCGGCGQFRLVYEFLYWFPWSANGRMWHPSMGRERAEPTLCEECGEEGGNHAGDCSTWPEALDDGTGRDDELTEFDIGWDWQPPDRGE